MAKTISVFVLLFITLPQPTGAQDVSGIFLLTSEMGGGYSFRELQTLGGRIAPSDINNDGVVVGYAQDESSTRNAVKWTAQGIERLATLPGDTSSVARSINDEGVVVGTSFRDVRDSHDINTAVVWDASGQIAGLATLGANYAQAADVNNVGTIAGTSRFSDQEFDLEPVIWTAAGEIQHLGNLGNDRSGSFGFHPTRAINNVGEVVGISNGHAFKWSQRDGLLDLGVLPEHTVSNPNDINDLGQVVGWNRRFDEHRGDVAFVWTAELGMQALEDIDNVDSTASAINNHGQIVGSIGKANADDQRAVLWESGKMVLLNELVQIDDPMLHLTSAGAINDAGQIIVRYRHIPLPNVPEPTGLQSLFVGLALCCLQNRKSRSAMSRNAS